MASGSARSTLCHVSPTSADVPDVAPPLSLAQIAASFSSRLDALRNDTDLTVTSLLKEIESASSRIHKRIKLEMQSCAQQIDECEREFAEFDEDVEDIKNHCEEYARKVQNSTSQHTKMLPELMKSVENSLEKLRCRFVV